MNRWYIPIYLLAIVAPGALLITVGIFPPSWQPTPDGYRWFLVAVSVLWLLTGALLLIALYEIDQARATVRYWRDCAYENDDMYGGHT